MPLPATVAGYRVGELAAFSAADLFGTAAAMAMARQRAQSMDGCSRGQPGRLLPVRGIGIAKVEALCARFGVSIASQPRCVLEVDPGSTLSRLWVASFPGIPVRSVDDFQSAAAIVDWVRRTLADS